MREFKKLPLELFIGYDIEQNSRVIELDASEMVEKYPSGILQLVCKRPGEETTYIAPSFEQDGGTLRWTLTSYDVEKAGQGLAIVALVDTSEESVKVLASHKIRTGIEEGLHFRDAERVDPEDSLIARVLAAVSQAQAYAQDAKEEADRAEAALDDVEGAKDQAVSAIETKGAETLASIPADYTTLSGDVSDLKSVVNDVANNGYTLETVIQGSYNAYGDVLPIMHILRNAGYLRIMPGCTLHFSPGQTITRMLYGLFDTTKTYVSDSDWYDVTTDIKFSEECYIICVFRTTSGGNVTPSEYDATVSILTTDISVHLNAVESDINDIKNDIALLKSKKIVIEADDIIQGSYDADGRVVTSDKRIRTEEFIQTNIGDTLHFLPGTNANQMLFGSFNTNKQFIEDSGWYTSEVNIDIQYDGYIIILFRNTSNNNDITPEQFDANVELIKYFANNDATIQIDEWQKKTYNARHIPNNVATPLTILHFSDLHSDQAALKRITDYAKNLTWIDDYICTGDMVANVAERIESWWPDNIMTCIGNHDAASYSPSTGYDWAALSVADRIAYYIAPFESRWNIIRGSDQSYYYKDYSTQNVRLIVLDSQIYKSGGADATAQTQWLSNTLASAITSNYHVLIAIHAPVNNAPIVNCNFSKFGRENMRTLSDSFTPQEVVSAVSDAITNGLHFIGYIVGHNHQDYIYKPTTEQIGFCVTCAVVAQMAQWTESDQHRGIHADAFNLVTIDTANTLVKIVRCGGADVDDHMRSRKAICFNYSTGEKVGEIL